MLITVVKGNPYLLNWFNPSILVVHGLVFAIAKSNVISEACCHCHRHPRYLLKSQHNPGDTLKITQMSGVFSKTAVAKATCFSNIVRTWDTVYNNHISKFKE